MATHEDFWQHITDTLQVLGKIGVLQVDIDQLRLEMEHDSDIFPDGTERKVEFTAGTPANTWSAWIEVEDDTPVTPITFSSKVIRETHVSGLLIEDISIKDKRYELEIAWGDDKIRILLHRFLMGDVVKKLAAIQFIRIRTASIPIGGLVYYRMRCEEALATCEISLRYHYHPL